LEVVHCFKFPTNEGLRLAYATAAGLPCVLSGIACRRECRRQARSSCRRRNQIAVDASLLEGAKLIQPSFCSASVTRRTNRTARRRHERYGRDQRGESRSVGTRPRLPPTPLQWTSRSTAALRAGRVPGADSPPRFDSLFRMWGLTRTKRPWRSSSSPASFLHGGSVSAIDAPTFAVVGAAGGAMWDARRVRSALRYRRALPSSCSTRCASTHSPHRRA